MKHRRTGALLAAVITMTVSFAHPAGLSASVADTKSTVYHSLDDARAAAPAPWPSQAVGNEMMMKYQNSPDFVSVYLDDERSVRVVLRGATPERFSAGDVEVTIVGAKYSLAELRNIANQVLAVNPDVLDVEIQADVPALLVHVDPEAPELIVQSAAVPTDVQVISSYGVRESLEAAEGGALVTGSGCTSGFRMNGNRVSTASHCSDTWGSINGVSMTHRSSRCVIDNQWASGSSTGTVIQGEPFTGSQFDPANGAFVWKYGVTSGWTYGYVGNYTTTTASCTVSILTYTGGTMGPNSAGGDSGGPYITEVWNGAGYSYYAHGTHRGRAGSTIYSVPISAINAQGWSVG